VFYKHAGTPADMHFHSVADRGAKLGIVFLLRYHFLSAVKEGDAEEVITRGDGTSETQGIAAVSGFQRSLQKQVVIGIDHKSYVFRLSHDSDIQGGLLCRFGAGVFG